MSTSTARHPRSATFAEIPAWVVPTTPDIHGFFAAIALADLEDGWFRLRKSDQRALLGCAPFGHCSLLSSGHEITVSRSVCFGTDGESITYPAFELAEKIKNGLTARPGVYAPLN